MRKTILASMVALAAFAVGSEARAAGWGVHSGEILNPGDNMIYGEAGWPDLAFGFQHGLSPKVDIGIRASLIFGWEYTLPFSHNAVFGLGARVPIRIQLMRGPKFSFYFHVDPGLKFSSFGCGGRYGGGGFCTYGSAPDLGLWVPLGMEFGIHLTRQATLSFGFDIPLYINVTNRAYATIPLLFGAGFEYDITDRIALGVNTRLGPVIFTDNAGYFGGGCGGGRFGGCGIYAPFGGVAQFVFGYRL
jgi:hypothetical protein